MDTLCRLAQAEVSRKIPGAFSMTSNAAVVHLILHTFWIGYKLLLIVKVMFICTTFTSQLVVFMFWVQFGGEGRCSVPGGFNAGEPVVFFLVELEEIKIFISNKRSVIW